jgi:hypothetical protein
MDVPSRTYTCVRVLKALPAARHGELGRLIARASAVPETTHDDAVLSATRVLLHVAHPKVLATVAERGRLDVADHSRMLLATELAVAHAAAAQRRGHARRHADQDEEEERDGDEGVVLVTAVHLRACYRFRRSFAAFTARQRQHETDLAAAGYDALVFQGVALGAGTRMHIRA